MQQEMRVLCSHEYKHPVKAVVLRFLGLLDTVGALGVPSLNPGTGISYEYYDTNDSWQVGIHTQISQNLASIDKFYEASCGYAWPTLLCLFPPVLECSCMFLL